MNNQDLLRRITVNPAIFGGKPIIRACLCVPARRQGIRIKVENILGLLEQGVTTQEILADYPDLEPEDIKACLAYACIPAI